MTTPTFTWSLAGPLTTAFTQASTCSENFVYYNGDDWSMDLDRHVGSCYPGNTRFHTFQMDRGPYESVFFSPGLCPSGWHNEYKYATKYVGWPGLQPGESIGLGYTATLGDASSEKLNKVQCASVLTSAVIAAPCSVCLDSLLTRQVEPTNEFGAPITVYDFAITVHWQESDVPMLAAAGASDGQLLPTELLFPSSTGISLPTATGTSKSTETSESTSGHSSGLSTAAMVGIGLGAGVCIIAIIVAAIILTIRRRKRAQHIIPPDHGLGELHGMSTLKGELSANQVNEIYSEATAKAELSGNKLAPASELAAGVTEKHHGSWSQTNHQRMATAAVELDSVPLTRSPSPGLEVTRKEQHAADPIGRSPTSTPTGPAPLPHRHRDDPRPDESRLREEERLLALRRATVAERLRLIEMDERLRDEQERVRRQLEELRVAP
ncbi:hypothetical protein OQA88_769 [Cercophora sp. LCS_1]